LTGKGPYGAYILKCCARDEIRELGNFIVPERGNLFNFVGVNAVRSIPSDGKGLSAANRPA
jgi:ribonucleoside-diphosphate reductase alpha chain